MFLKNISLTFFRNYQKYSLQFKPLTIITGANGRGKTNLIEAVFLLSNTFSYRTKKNKNLIHTGEGFYKVEAEIIDKKLKFFFENDTCSKKLFINEIAQKTSDYLGNFSTVLFAPESLQIIIGGPEQRRRFLNIILAQLDKNYSQSIIRLAQVLANRNKLLWAIKNKQANINELDFWNEELLKLNNYIVAQRAILISDLNKRLQDFYQQISNSTDKLLMKYLPNLDHNTDLELIKNNLGKEIEQGFTLYGPQRDDWRLYLNKFAINEMASRGELRSAILALKLSELAFLKEKKNQEVVLLLDDVFSELDEQRTKKIMDLVLNQQTIITTTDKNNFSPTLLKKAKVVELN